MREIYALHVAPSTGKYALRVFFRVDLARGGALYRMQAVIEWHCIGWGNCQRIFDSSNWGRAARGTVNKKIRAARVFFVLTRPAVGLIQNASSD